MNIKRSIDKNLSYVHAVSTHAVLTRATTKELIDQRAIDSATKVALVFPNQIEFTYKELQISTHLLAQNLLEMGFVKGDRLCIAVDDTHESILMQLAAFSIGLIATLFNKNHKRIEFETLLKKTGAKGLFIFDSLGTKSFIEIMCQMIPEIDECERGQIKSAMFPQLRHVIVLSVDKEIKLPRSCWSYAQIAFVRLNEQDHEWPYVDTDDRVMTSYSSGTTGVPKGVTHKLSALVNWEYVTRMFTEPLVTCQKSDQPSRICLAIPYLHALMPFLLHGVLHGFFQAVLPFDLNNQFNAEGPIRAARVYKYEALAAAPRMLSEIVSHVNIKSADLDQIECVFALGSSLNVQLISTYKEKLTRLRTFSNCYGMSECNGVARYDLHVNFNIDFDGETYCPLGFTMPLFECKLVDMSTGQIVPFGTCGVLYTRSPFQMVEYWNEPEKTSQALDKNGWLCSGDILTMDKEGCMYFRSRLKEIIKIYDISVYPLEIESFLLQCPNVHESCVFGIRLDDYKEAICAWIKLKSNNESSSDAVKRIREFCQKNFSDLKAPEYIKIVDTLGTQNGLGKLKRFQLADQYKLELGL